MDSTYHLSPASLRTWHRWHLLVALALAALLLLLPWLFGIGPNSWRDCLGGSVTGATHDSAPAVVSAPAPTVTQATPPAAPVVAPAADALPVARVYFALDKFDLPADTGGTLAEVIAYLKANPAARALVSGFHDPRGNTSANQELAHNRARAVRGALEAAGIAVARIVMDKPQETTGTGPNDEARRVEVRVQP
jgi:outer membrane protein OmpA-like peptidoglycan-associated protein